MYTPEQIKSLGPNEVFVFGTNQFGQHAGGAAMVAHELFGAVNGIPMGLSGQSYGIITTSFNDVPVLLEAIRTQVNALYHFATLRPELTLYVTKIGTGIAGFTIEEIRQVFHSADCPKPNNIILPIEFSK